MDPESDASLIVFLDVETTIPPERIIVEFGVILVCPRKLVEKSSYSTFVRPHDLSIITPGLEAKGITRDEVANARSFVDIAHKVFNLLDGKTWAGHCIEEYDAHKIKEGFQEIGWQPPVPRGIIDTCRLLKETFGSRAGNMKLKSLALYFDLGNQSHRALDDARMALQVFKNCGAVLFLESTYPKIYVWISPDDVSVESINVFLTPFYCGNPKPKIQILHNNVRLKLWCVRMNVRLRPRRFSQLSPLTFVVDAPESLCEVLGYCNVEARSLFEHSGSTSKWHDVITGYAGRANVRLRIDYGKTEIFSKRRTGAEERMPIRNDQELVSNFEAGTFIDALFMVDTYDYGEHAGIALLPEKLVVHQE